MIYGNYFSAVFIKRVCAINVQVVPIKMQNTSHLWAVPWDADYTQGKPYQPGNATKAATREKWQYYKDDKKGLNIW